MEDNIIDVNGLEYFFGEVKAVDNINFTVRKGEIFSFFLAEMERGKVL